MGPVRRAERGAWTGLARAGRRAARSGEHRRAARGSAPRRPDRLPCLAAAAARPPAGGAPVGELRLINDLPIGFDPGGFDAWIWQPMLGAASLGRAAGRLQPRRPALGPAAVRAGPAAAGRLPAVHRHHPGGDGARRRPADRPRAGAVPPVVGAGWRGPGRRRLREPTHRRAAGGAGHRGRAGRGRRHRRGPGHRGAGRPAAPGIGQRAVHAPRLLRARPPTGWPRKAMAGVTTHDLPTVAGTWTGADLADQARAGVRADRRGLALLRRRLARLAGMPSDAPLARGDRGACTRPSAPRRRSWRWRPWRTRCASAVARTCPARAARQRDNWSRALPVTLEEIERSRSVRRRWLAPSAPAGIGRLALRHQHHGGERGQHQAQRGGLPVPRLVRPRPGRPGCRRSTRRSAPNRSSGPPAIGRRTGTPRR